MNEIHLNCNPKAEIRCGVFHPYMLSGPLKPPRGIYILAMPPQNFT
ncbi:MAG: hypothetical protein ACJARR_000525 [Pseudophaeobacter arcticus]|jgi:hypothetical protein